MGTVDDQILSSRILIVDDEPANVMLLEEVLASQDYTNVWSTQDPRDVKALQLEHDFDLIMLDIRMPHMNGIEVMQELDNIIKDDYLPILVLTAQTDTETRLNALANGAKDFLTKPFQQAEVLQRIRNMLEVRQYYNMKNRYAETLERDVQIRTQELQDTRLQIIHYLGRAGEYRDNETGNHVIRMSKSCQLLGQSVGLSDDVSEMLLYASPMHDVGKIGIPDAILLKPGNFEPNEWEIMKSHVEIGADILSTRDSPLMEMAYSIALSHHEKWNGSGYPQGLTGTDIPIEGRIAAIADVFDALTSERPYKKAWPVEKAVDLLKKESGAHFDPELVEKFLEKLPMVLDVRDEYTDAAEGQSRLEALNAKLVQATG
jgi:putative two-component system response regulator